MYVRCYSERLPSSVGENKACFFFQKMRHLKLELQFKVIALIIERTFSEAGFSPGCATR